MSTPILEEETFDFSKYRSLDGEEITNESINIEEKPEESTPLDFSQYREKPEETPLGTLGRGAVRTASRIAETILGFPGDIVQFSKSLSESLPKIDEREPNIVRQTAQKALDYIPTSEDIKKFSSYLSNGFTDPQSASEELGDEIASLSTVLINPTKSTKFVPFLKDIGKSIFKASAAKGAGKGAELFGAGDKTKAAVELGTLGLTSLISSKTADRYVKDLYEKSRSSIPKGTMVSTKGLEAELSELEKSLAKGVSTNSKNEVQSALREIKGKASGGAMELDELVESVHNINERIGSKKLFDELSTTEKKQLRSRYDQLKKPLMSVIDKYGKNNPDFYKNWKGANEAFGTIANSKKVSQFIQSKTGSLPKHLVGSIALDLFTGQPAAVVGVPAAYGLVKSGELLSRIIKSPSLREHYKKVLFEAGNENLPATIKHLNALDKEAKNL